MLTAPLRGLRVLELSEGIVGPYAGRLMSMLGATVVKAECGGLDVSRRTRIDVSDTVDPSPVFVHLNTGKRLVRRTPDAVAHGLAWADLVVADGPPRDSQTDQPLWLHITPPPHPDDEALVQAASGLLAASTAEDGTPLRFPGWQSQYLAGAYAAVLAAAALLGGHRTVRLPWHDVLPLAFEAQAAADLYTATAPIRSAAESAANAGHLASTFPSGIFACADGFVVPGTVRPVDWTRQCSVYGREDLAYDERFVWANRWSNRERLREEIRDWYRARTKHEIFASALDAGWALGTVMTCSDALMDPHLEARRFIRPVIGGDGARTAARPWRSRRTVGAQATSLRSAGEDDRWFATQPARSRRTNAPAPTLPLAGHRVLELTLAWAGPLTGSILGALGADVVRVETGRRPDGWRSRRRLGDLGITVPAGTDPDTCTWDASAQFNSVNRNKRAISLDLDEPAGAALFEQLAARADALVINVSADVLDKRGLRPAVERLVERGLVVLVMPALGQTGPAASMPGYGSTIEALGGFAARYGRPEAGAGISKTYFPDAVAGIHGAAAVLFGWLGRASDGYGDWIDLAQHETLWLQLGEGLVYRSRDGREPLRLNASAPGRAGPVTSITSRWETGELLRTGRAEYFAHPVAGHRAYLTLPGTVGPHRLTSRRPAPCFDEHTDEVLAEWIDLDAAAIEHHRASRVIGTLPKQPRRRRSPR
ncbi:CoA transferase [Kribbella sp. NPDC050820]|uniref:CoA transferase n=1 Tax=Kribbella sp. NPDC050820 TaxID=3155408 RepID=UPI0033DEC1E4